MRLLEWRMSGLCDYCWVALKEGSVSLNICTTPSAHEGKNLLFLTLINTLPKINLLNCQIKDNDWHLFVPLICSPLIAGGAGLSCGHWPFEISPELSASLSHLFFLGCPY